MRPSTSPHKKGSIVNHPIVVGVFVAVLLGACTERTPALKKLDEQAATVGIMALQWPKVVSSNEGFAVTVAVRNVGGQALPSLGARSDGALRINATYHWKTGDGKAVVWDGILTPLDHDLAVGAEQTLNLAISPPPAAGKYVLEIDLVQTGAFWFGGVGSQTASMVIEVK